MQTDYEKVNPRLSIKETTFKVANKIGAVKKISTVSRNPFKKQKLLSSRVVRKINKRRKLFIQLESDSKNQELFQKYENILFFVLM